MNKTEDEDCPECGRKKARTVDQVLAGDCPKWWAIRDPMAEHDCDQKSRGIGPDKGD